MSVVFPETMPKLGFGLMRLPKNEDGSIDIEQTKKMVDLFMASGMRYFDTAFVYPGSEEAIKEALVDRYPRDSYFLTTKVNSKAAGSEEKAKQQILQSLEKTGAGYFDFYLLRAIQEENIHLYNDYGLFDYVKELKAEGKIKHYGFSFHSNPKRLNQILTDHPDIEVVQLQLNYADWENPSVTSRENYEVCVKHNKPVIVMEPIKGGTLANPPQRVCELFKDANPDLSVASWAVRYVASLENVMVVLSGMSNIAQMEDNLSYMKEFKVMSEEEKTTIAKAQDILSSVRQIACTGCHYCTPGCPMQIAIPEMFTAMNRSLIFNQEKEAKELYKNAAAKGSPASACIGCKQCEGVCPQHLPITDWLHEIASNLE